MLGRTRVPLSLVRLGYNHSLPPLTPLRPVRTFASSSVLETENKDAGGFLSAESCYAEEGATNRWAMAVPAFLTHLSIGTPWAWSVMSPIVGQEYGFVTQAASDWSFMEVTLPMSIIFMGQGLLAAAAGSWQMKVGPRKAMAVAAGCFGGGMLIGAAGIATHSLPLLYAGYGVLAGTGVGLAYTPPVQALVEWFPDRRAVATGLTIAGFGSGSLVAAPLTTYLCKLFSTSPTYLGTVEEVDTSSEGGRLFADVGGSLAEVVIASSADIAKLPYEGLMEGVYVVGSGNTGAAAAMAAMGVGWFSLMSASALALRRPHPSYVPEGWTPPPPGSSTAAAAGNVKSTQVMKTPQYYHLATTFFCVACGGMGLFAVAKPMMSEIFSSSLPAIVTSAFASSYVLALSAGNLGGRLGWAAVSDAIGRRPTFHIFTLASIPLFLSVPYFVHQAVETGSSLMLYGFIGATVTSVTIMGGVYATLPAYESDIFGVKYVGANHGRMLLASTAAALAGPSLLVGLRSRSESAAITDLLTQIDRTRFEEFFGASMDEVEALVESKTVTIAKLMEITPAGVTDPTPFIYDSTMYAMGGLMGVAALAHATMGPVDPKHFEVIEEESVKEAVKVVQEEAKST